MLASLALLTLCPPSSDWEFVKGGITSGISGMSLLAAGDDFARFLIVHDNKVDGQGRAAVVTTRRGDRPLYEALTWDGSPFPVDLESLSAIPGSSNFLAMTSKGEGYVIEASPKAVRVQSTFKLSPVPNTNYEGATLQLLGGRTWLVWGHRGALPEPGKLFWSEFDVPTGKPVGTVSSQDVSVPWPTAETSRGVSDLRVDPSGTLFLTASSDFGDDGPFQSVLYVGGVFRVEGGTLALQPSTPVRLWWSSDQKVEALELVPGRSGGIALGTDDENLGGSLWHNLWLK